jgi:hypothetical protein
VRLGLAAQEVPALKIAACLMILTSHRVDFQPNHPEEAVPREDAIRSESAALRRSKATDLRGSAAPFQGEQASAVKERARTS